MIQRIAFWTTLVLVVAGPFPGLDTTSTGDPESPAAYSLRPGEAIERRPRTPTLEAFQLPLSQGRRTIFSVVQSGLDAEVTLLDPQGQTVGYMDLLTGPRGTDAIRITAEVSGTYTLVVKLTSQRQSAAASYRVHASQPEPHGHDDWLFNQANRTLGKVAEFQAMHENGEMPQELLEELRDAATLFRRLGAPQEELMAVSLAAKYLHCNERRREALAAYQHAAGLCASLKMPGCAANFSLNVARLERRLGEPQKALDADRQAIRHAEADDAVSTKIEALLDLAELESWLGDSDKAMLHLENAAQLINQAGEVPDWTDLQHMGSVLLGNGNYSQASAVLTRVLDLMEPGPRSVPYGTTLLRLGQVALAQNNGPQAERYFLKALQVFEDNRNLGAVEAHLSLGQARLMVHRQENARQSFQRARTLAESFGDAHLEVEALYWLARLARDGDDLPRALSLVEEAEVLARELHKRRRTAHLQALATASSAALYELYIDVLMGLHEQDPEGGHARRAFEVNERHRYRALLAMLHDSHSLMDEYATAEQLTRRAALNRRINRATSNLLTNPQDDATPHVDLEELLSEYQALQQEILDRNPHYQRLADTGGLTLDQVRQQVLDEDSVLLQYALGEKRSFLWMVTRDSFQVFPLSGRREIEAQALKTYHLLIAPGEPVMGDRLQAENSLRQAVRDYPQVARRLSELILGPVIGQVGDRRLLIAADGGLLYIPFAALPDPRYQGTRPTYEPLLLRNEIGYLPSASSLQLLRRDPWKVPEKPLVAMILDPVYSRWDPRLDSLRSAAARHQGDPASSRGFPALMTQRQSVSLETLPRLEGSAREGEAILGLGGGEFTVWRGFSATIDQVLGPSLENADFLHFAVHGLVDPRHPELSGLALTRIDKTGEELEGFLSLHDIYTLNLRAQVVTLSACRTALGKEIDGEGLIGLTRGFLHAGVPRVVASLWQVGDAQTAELMPDFYRHMLLEGQRPAAALRRAQITIWQQLEDRELPYGWAAFIVQGDWR